MKLKKSTTLLLVFFLFSIFINAQSSSDRNYIKRQTNTQALQKIITDASYLNKTINAKSSRQKTPLTKIKKDGRIGVLYSFDQKGQPVYAYDDNIEAAISGRTDKIWTGGSSGLNLNGAGIEIGVWERGKARASHQEFEGRASAGDDASVTSHGTHTGGTLIAAGIDPKARGMASAARIKNYSASGMVGEAAAFAAAGGILANNSNTPNGSDGVYDANARDMDNVTYNAPFYLHCKSAGNEGNGSKYGVIFTNQLAKNLLVVANSEDVSNYTGPSSVTLSKSSSFGPSNDWRIKPDITNNGRKVYSSDSGSNSDYGVKSGTSMSTPATAGTIALLQQHYKNLNGVYMRAATAKGLIIDAADEIGANDGPDFSGGWGLVNAERAAQIISNNGNTSIMDELTLNNGDTYTRTINSDGSTPLALTIVWNDPAGQISSGTNPVLVNDLDVRVTGNNKTYSPWVMVPNSAFNNYTAPAQKGDNFRDNVEKIDAVLSAGSYTVTVTHKGTLTNGSQEFSLIVNGVIVNSDTETPSVPTSITATNTTTNSTDLSWTASTDNVGVTAYEIFQNGSSIATVATTNLSITGLTPSTSYSFTIKAKDAAGNSSASSSPISVTTSAPIPDNEAPSAPNGLSASNSTQTSTGLSWTASTDNIGVTEYEVFQNGMSVGTTSTTSFNITGLVANTTYNFTVKAKDAAGNVSNSSNTLNVTTSPIPSCTGITNFPYNESFESNLGLWTQGSNDDINWTIDSNGTPSSRTGPSNASDGNNYIYTEASGNGNGFPNKIAILTSPCIDLSGQSNSELSFDYHMYGSNMGTLEILVSTDNGATWTNIWTKSGNQGNNWNSQSISLSTYSNSVIQLQLKGTTGSGFRSDIAIDNLKIASFIIDTEAPSVPLSLTASNIGSTTLDISWTAASDNVGVLEYEVFRNDVSIGTTNSTNFNVTGLTAETTYSFTIKAKDAAGNASENSTTINVTTNQIVVVTEQTLVENTSGGDKIEVNDGQSGAQSFKYTTSDYFINKVVVYLSKDKDAPNTDLEFNVGTAVNNGSISGSIKNIKASEINNTSEGSSFTKYEIAFASPVGPLVAGTTYYLNFENNGSNGNKYYLEYSGGNTYPDGTYYKSGDNDGKDIKFQIIGSEIVVPDTEAPSVPVDLIASNTTVTTTDLSWTAATDNVGVTGYEVFQNGTSIGTNTTPNFSVTGLVANTVYNFTITAKDEAGNVSAASSALSVTTLPPPDTQAPTAPTTLVASNVTDVNLDLSWTAATDNVAVTGYDIFRGSTKIGTSATTAYTVNGLTAETAYNFTVKAKDAAGNISVDSNIVTVTTAAPAPDTQVPTAPTGLTSSNITQTSLKLSWTAATDNAGVTGYDIFQEGILIDSAVNTNYTVTGLTAETRYSFTVKAKDAAGNVSGNSNTLSVTTSALRYTLTTNTIGQGSISGSGTYDSGEIVNVQATASTGWEFAGWTGDLSGSINPQSLTINTNKTVTATFTEVIQISTSTEKYRLTWREDPSTTMVIGWNQVRGTNPVVHYGPTDFGTSYSSYPSIKVVDRSVSSKGMNNRYARITGLLPDTAYYFVIKDSEGVSKRYWFKTAPNNPNTRLSIVAGGDSRNNRTPRQNANKLVAKIRPHAVFFGGDMTSSSSSSQWKNWMNDWQLTIGTDGRMIPVVAARGNHESSNDIRDLFDIPTAAGGEFYALSFGGNLMRTYTLNTEVTPGGTQGTWLANDLAAQSANHTWAVAQYHRATRPHQSGKSEQNDQYEAWSKPFYANAVQLVMESDSHVVKRTWPIKPSTGSGSDEGFTRADTDPKRAIYVGEGCWGAPLRSANDSKSWTKAAGSFNQFKWLWIDQNKIELRTVKVDNANSVGQLSDVNQFTLPTNIDIWNPTGGSVVTINNPHTVRASLTQANNIASAKNQTITEKSLIIHPNPIKYGVLHLTYPNYNKAQKAEAVIKDMSGHIVDRIIFTAETAAYNVDELSSGIYFIVIKTGKGEITEKILKK